jgi:hypothetical protein
VDIAALFVRVLELSREMGLLKLGTVALDGTKKGDCRAARRRRQRGIYNLSPVHIKNMHRTTKSAQPVKQATRNLKSGHSMELQPVRATEWNSGWYLEASCRAEVKLRRGRRE